MHGKCVPCDFVLMREKERERQRKKSDVLVRKAFPEMLIQGEKKRVLNNLNTPSFYYDHRSFLHQIITVKRFSVEINCCAFVKLNEELMRKKHEHRSNRTTSKEKKIRHGVPHVQSTFLVKPSSSECI